MQDHNEKPQSHPEDSRRRKMRWVLGFMAILMALGVIAPGIQAVFQ